MGRTECGKIPRVYRHLPILITSLCVFAAVSANADDVIQTAAELSRISSQKGTAGRQFQLRATAISSLPETTGRQRKYNTFFVADESGGVRLYDARKSPGPPALPGDQVEVSGRLDAILPHDKPNSRVMANCQSLKILSHGVAPAPVRISANDFDRNDLLNKSVLIGGILLEVRQDEIDPAFTMFVIDCSSRMVFISCKTLRLKRPLTELQKHIGATVEICGIPYLHMGLRQLGRRWLYLESDNSIRILKPPSDDLFRTKELETDDSLSPEAISALGRRRATGRVLAVWNGDTMLLRTRAGEPMKVGVVTTPPSVGSDIETVGYAETDLFHINLAHAIWRPTQPLNLPPEEELSIDARTLLVDDSGKRKLNVALHGKTVRLRGIVRNVPSDEHSSRRLTLDSDGYMVPVDCSAAPTEAATLRIGSTVAVSGVCIVETETWNRYSNLPATHGLFLSLRAPSDIEIVSLPPWWTTGRLASVIVSLLLILFAVLIWNRSLHALAEKRSKALACEELERLESDLKAAERTRLSVELHDSIAQNLSGVSMEIGTVLDGGETLPPVAEQHLTRASRTLDSCRVELRNCIWDLRSRALDAPDMDAAIRIALGPTIGKTHLHIRFNVSRSRFADNTARTILNIIRELTSNAVRHGQATEIKIAGALEGETLSFSVCDNGHGFRPEKRPGVMEGHFGLQGIEERVATLGGRMELASSPDHGAKVVIKIHVPTDTDKERI